MRTADTSTPACPRLRDAGSLTEYATLQAAYTTCATGDDGDVCGCRGQLEQALEMTFICAPHLPPAAVSNMHSTAAFFHTTCDSGAGTTLQFNPPSYAAASDDATESVLVSRRGSSAGAVTARLSVLQEGMYTGQHADVSFADGAFGLVAATVSLAGLGPRGIESSREVTVAIGSVSGEEATAGTPRVATITITAANRATKAIQVQLPSTGVVWANDATAKLVRFETAGLASSHGSWLAASLQRVFANGTVVEAWPLEADAPLPLSGGAVRLYLAEEARAGGARPAAAASNSYVVRVVEWRNIVDAHGNVKLTEGVSGTSTRFSLAASSPGSRTYPHVCIDCVSVLGRELLELRWGVRARGAAGGGRKIPDPHALLHAPASLPAVSWSSTTGSSTIVVGQSVTVSWPGAAASSAGVVRVSLRRVGATGTAPPTLDVPIINAAAEAGRFVWTAQGLGAALREAIDDINGDDQAATVAGLPGFYFHAVLVDTAGVAEASTTQFALAPRHGYTVRRPAPAQYYRGASVLALTPPSPHRQRMDPTAWRVGQLQPCVWAWEPLAHSEVCRLSVASPEFRVGSTAGAVPGADARRPACVHHQAVRADACCVHHGLVAPVLAPVRRWRATAAAGLRRCVRCHCAGFVMPSRRDPTAGCSSANVQRTAV